LLEKFLIVFSIVILLAPMLMTKRFLQKVKTIIGTR